MARPSQYPSVGRCTLSLGYNHAFLSYHGDVLNCKWSLNCLLGGGNALIRIDINRHDLNEEESANPGEFGGKKKRVDICPPFTVCGVRS